MDTVSTELLASCSREVDSLQQKVCYGTSEYFPHVSGHVSSCNRVDGSFVLLSDASSLSMWC